MIELLVVVAIIGVLAGLLLPALSRAKAVAKRAHCTSNLRQISIGFAMYVGDHGAYPTDFGPFGNSITDFGASWDTITPTRRESYREWRDSQRLFQCPTQRHDWNFYTYNHDGSGWLRRIQEQRPSLGLDPRNVPPYTPFKESIVKVPSDMIAFGEIGVIPLTTVLRGITGGFPTPAHVPANPTWFHFRYHPTGANVAFCDGHIEFMTRARANTNDVNQRRRWNNDHEPHSEYWR